MIEFWSRADTQRPISEHLLRHVAQHERWATALIVNPLPLRVGCGQTVEEKRTFSRRSMYSPVPSNRETMKPIFSAFILASILALPFGVHAQKPTGRQVQPPRPSLPFAIDESVWQTLEASEMYRNAPRTRALRLRTEYESTVEYTGSGNRDRKPDAPKVSADEWEIIPLGEKCVVKKPRSGSDVYSCGRILLGVVSDGRPFNPLKSLGPLSGSLYPPSIGAEERVEYQRDSSLAPGSMVFRNTRHCRITRSMQANQLDSRLTGTAWAVSCKEESNTLNQYGDPFSRSRPQPRVTEYEDYLIETLGIMLSTIGVMNYEQKRFVVPAPGLQTVKVIDGDQGSRSTSAYRSHEWTVGSVGAKSAAAPLSMRADQGNVSAAKGGKKNGQGTLALSSGGKYVGEFRNDKFDGQGTLTSSYGEPLYVGAWKNGMRNGQGTETKNGTEYVGEWKDDKYNGQGTITYGTKDKYVGAWKDDKRNGQGTFTRPGEYGYEYVGEWKNDKYNGQGTYTYRGKDKNTYVGAWKDDKRNGQGTQTLSSGNEYVGEWKDDTRNGQGTLTWPSGEKYVGEFRDGKFNGQGTFTWLSGEKYVGEFRDGKFNGQGTRTLASGDKYVGEFKDDKQNGQGIEYNAKGTDQCAGTWENDNIVKEDPGCWAVQRRADAALAEARRQADAKRAAKQKRDEADEAEERREAAAERARKRASEDDDTPSVTFAGLLAETIRDVGSFNRDINAQTNAAISAAQDIKRRKDEAASERAEEKRLERAAEIERRNEGIRARNVEIARENKQLLEDSRRRQEAASARKAEHAQAAQQAKEVQQRAQDDEQRRKEAKAQIAAQQRASNTLNQQMQQQANQQAYDSAQAARQPRVMQPDVIASNLAAGGNTKEKPKKTLKNPGESANLCLTVTSLGTAKLGGKDTNKIGITNNCGQDVFVLYCGDLWATSKRCGSSPKSYYTQSSNLGPNKSTDFSVLANGSYQYAGCVGSISFGNDGEYRDEGNGSISCLPR